MNKLWDLIFHDSGDFLLLPNGNITGRHSFFDRNAQDDMRKADISNALRMAGLIYGMDHVRCVLEKIRNSSINREFLRNNPDVRLPPDDLMYESYQLNYARYYHKGKETAQWLAGLFAQYIELENERILDWGCGPGRVIRHLPDILGIGCSYHGTDYNERSITWCRNALEGIHFTKNGLSAQLPFRDDHFGVIYGISILTHLSVPMHHAWYQELYRVLKPGGILLLTTQGDNFRSKLTDSELLKFDNGQFVVRGKVKEGHRTYSAFHPRSAMLQLFSDAEVLEHIVPDPVPGKSIPQDVWIVRKP